MLSFVVCVSTLFVRCLTTTTTKIFCEFSVDFNARKKQQIETLSEFWFVHEIDNFFLSFITMVTHICRHTCTRKFNLPPSDFCFWIFNRYWNASDSFCNVNHRFVNWFSNIMKSDRFEILMSFVIAPNNKYNALNQSTRDGKMKIPSTRVNTQFVWSKYTLEQACFDLYLTKKKEEKFWLTWLWQLVWLNETNTCFCCDYKRSLCLCGGIWHLSDVPKYTAELVVVTGDQ